MSEFIIVCGILYFLPMIVAMLRGKANAGAIAVLNFFLGWTLIGWVVALTWACMAENKRADY